MKKLKHSKYKNTGLLFEMLVHKLTSETMSSNRTITADLIKKYFGKNTELSKELCMYTSLIKETFSSEAQAFEYIRTMKLAHSNLNQSLLKRQRYNLIKEISQKFLFENMSKMHIPNYKSLASICMIFDNVETANPKQLLECKFVIFNHRRNTKSNQLTNEKDSVLETFKAQSTDMRLLTYKLIVDKFNQKYSVLDESQKQLLNKYITNINDTTALKEYIQTIIPKIKTQLATQSKQIADTVTKIKVKKLSEMLCTVENMKTIKESHVLSLLRYFDLIRELKEIHA